MLGGGSASVAAVGLTAQIRRLGWFWPSGVVVLALFPWGSRCLLVPFGHVVCLGGSWWSRLWLASCARVPWCCGVASLVFCSADIGLLLGFEVRVRVPRLLGCWFWFFPCLSLGDLCKDLSKLRVGCTRVGLLSFLRRLCLRVGACPCELGALAIILPQ